MTAADGAVRLERSEGPERAGGRRATIRIERPPLNILDLDTLEALGRAIDELEGVQVLVVCGTERAFSAGVAVEDHVGERIRPMLETFHAVLRSLREIPAVSIAQVRGHCLGGGLELASCCDLVLASRSASFGVPEIELGCYPPVAAALYPALIGRHRTIELLVTGRTLRAEEAAEIGLVNRAVDDEDLESATEELVATILSKSAAVTPLLKRAVEAGERLPFSEALDEAERIYLEELVETDDMHEGIAAFMERRDPEWSHS